MSAGLNTFGAGDSLLLHDILSVDLASESFYKLREEIEWNDMSHKGGAVPRLIAIQGEVSPEGVWPLYRHPADEQPPLLPWHPTVRAIKDIAEKLVDQTFNHVLIQYYRNSLDYISPHSDKTLDILRGTKIVNVSLGACRTMQLKSKDEMDVGKPAQRVSLTHNSLFVLGWESNKLFLHGIKQDKRDIAIKRLDEMAFDGERISLTFRTVATFVDLRGFIFGQGAKPLSDFVETADAPSIPTCSILAEKMQSHVESIDPIEMNEEIISSGRQEKAEDAEDEGLRLIKAFSAENKRPDFDWDEHYGGGFSVVNVAIASRPVPKTVPPSPLPPLAASGVDAKAAAAAAAVDGLDSLNSALTGGAAAGEGGGSTAASGEGDVEAGGEYS